MKNEKEIMELFCAKDDIRPILKKPFQIDEYTYATDTHSLICIPNSILNEKYDDTDKMKYAVQLKDNPSNTKIPYLLKIEDLERIIKEAQTEDEEIEISPEVVCEDCDGDGEVEWEYRDIDWHTHHEYHRCPVCNGSGIKYPAKYKKTGKKCVPYSALFNIGGIFFMAYQIERLYKLMLLMGLDSVKWDLLSDCKPNRFTMDNIILVIMSAPRDSAKIYGTISFNALSTVS